MFMEIEIQLDKIETAANMFWQQVQGHGSVFAFEGEMGVGKTTFISALCRAKGIRSSSSPTFSLINEYAYSENGVETSLFHMDMYRVKDEDEALNAGVEDCIYSGKICMIEWPVKIQGLLPPNTIFITLSLKNAHTRLLKVGGAS